MKAGALPTVLHRPFSRHVELVAHRRPPPQAAVLQDTLAERTDIMDVNECLRDFVATAPLVSRLDLEMILPWWAHQGSNLGPAD